MGSQSGLVQAEFLCDHANHVFAAVSVQIVHDEDPARRGIGGDGVLDVFREVGVVTRFRDRRRDQLSGDHIPVGRHADRAVTRVLEFFLGGLTGFGRLGGGASFVGLQARHLIHAHGVRVALIIKPRCVEIRLANRLDLLLKQFRILLGGVAPILTAMRLQIDFAQEAIHLAGGNRIDELAFLSLVRQFVPSPGRHRTIAVLGRFTRQADEAHDLLGGELPRRSTAWRIAETIADGSPKRRRRFRELHPQQRRERISPTSSPQADRLGRQLHFGSDGLIVEPLKSQQDDLGSRHDRVSETSTDRQLA